jgi:O-antigen/teichoic acid export membrane protein
LDNKVTENKEERLEKDDILDAMLPDVAEEVASEISPNDAEADILSAESVASVETGIQSATETQTDGGDKKVEAPVRESRVKKTLLNARVNLIFYFLNLILSFFTRKIFLDCLGTEFMGLTGTLQNLLGFLNLAELGIGGAIGFLLYKPLFDRNQQKINEIISVMGYLYRWIGIIILGGGVIMSCFLPLIFPDTGFNLALIYFAFYSFLASSLIGYFINYRQNLLGADQKNYVVAAYFQTGNIVKTIIQMALAYYTGSYYLWVAIELAFGIIYSVILNWKINKTYPWLAADVRLGKRMFKKYPEVMKKTKQLFVHRISAFVQFQTSPLFIYAYVSLNTVALFQNYTIIFSKISIVLSQMLGGVSASVGNLIAEGNKSKINTIYWQLTSFYFFMYGIALFGFYSFSNEFITQWLGKEYLLPFYVVILSCINFFINIFRNSNDPFLFGFGLFNDTWAPIAESAIYAIVAIVGGYYWGLKGILLATTISGVMILGIWKPYFLFTKGIGLGYIYYLRRWLPYPILMICSIYLVEELMGYIRLSFMSGWWNLIINAVISLSIFIALYFIMMLLLFPVFRDFMRRFIPAKFNIR